MGGLDQMRQGHSPVEHVKDRMKQPSNVGKLAFGDVREPDVVTGPRVIMRRTTSQVVRPVDVPRIGVAIRTVDVTHTLGDQKQGVRPHLVSLAS